LLIPKVRREAPDDVLVDLVSFHSEELRALPSSSVLEQEPLGLHHGLKNGE
jgi:hypothetical protein